MQDSSPSCPKCNGKMEAGFMMMPTSVSLPLKWFAGTWVRGWFKNYGSGEEQHDVQVFRCSACGFIECYAK